MVGALDRGRYQLIHAWFRVACRYPHPWYAPPPMVYTRNPREGRPFRLKRTDSHRDGPVTFEAMQLRGVSKVATLTWTGHGFGLCRAQLLSTPRGGCGCKP